MQPEASKLIWDMADAAEKIGRFSTGRSFQDYVSDDYFRSAVERQFATIGEAMTRLMKVSPETAERITDYRKIRGFRNVIVHGYDAIDPETTWGVIEHKLPLLRDELAKLLAEAAEAKP